MRDDAPYILAFDSAGAYCAATLICGDTVLVQRAEPMARGQAERLMPMLEEVLRAGGIAWRDLSALGVGIGPGNFTGIRIAVSAARGLALGLGGPAVGVSHLEALGWGQSPPLTLVLPAPRDQTYRQVIETDGPKPPQLVPKDASPPPGPARHGPLTPEALTLAIAQITATRWQDPAPAPAPLYLRPPDAAPARPGPALLKR